MSTPWHETLARLPILVEAIRRLAVDVLDAALGCVDRACPLALRPEIGQAVVWVVLEHLAQQEQPCEPWRAPSAEMVRATLHFDVPIPPPVLEAAHTLALELLAQSRRHGQSWGAVMSLRKVCLLAYQAELMSDRSRPISSEGHPARSAILREVP